MTEAAPGTAVRLTELTGCGGCAAKWGAAGLRDLVAGWGGGEPDALLVGLAPFDDELLPPVNDLLAGVRIGPVP